jgi:hypothetical protein
MDLSLHKTWKKMKMIMRNLKAMGRRSAIGERSQFPSFPTHHVCRPLGQVYTSFPKKRKYLGEYSRLPAVCAVILFMVTGSGDEEIAYLPSRNLCFPEIPTI